MKTFSTKAKILLLLMTALIVGTPGSAQHSHGVLSPSVTFPQDDAVLRDPPQMIAMSFRVDVQLLKLTLWTDKGEWINIGFIYVPDKYDDNYVTQLPESLPESEYYVAEWSVVDDSQRFLQGEFRFSFGPDALPPSEIIEASYTYDAEENLPSTGAYARPPIVPREPDDN